MMYAKLQNNALQVAQKQVQWEGQTVINPNKDILLALGYLPVQYTDPPAVDDGYYAAPRWTKTETAIVQEWDVVKDTRPLTAEEVNAMLIRQQINSLAVDDNTALRMREFYPDWAAGQDYPEGFKVQFCGVLYKVLQAHTSQDGWEPENAPSLWTEICESHAGTLTDPIPYGGNMALEAGKYYSQNGAVYLCTRDTVNPVYNALADLVGMYVEIP